MCPSMTVDLIRKVLLFWGEPFEFLLLLELSGLTLDPKLRWLNQASGRE